METSEMIWIATWAFSRKIDREELQYSAYMRNHEDLVDEVWKFVTELKEIGQESFYEKYKQFKLYLK